METFRDWLVRRLREEEMTRTRLGKLIGVDPSTVSNWTLGKDVPRPDKVRLIAREFRADPIWLLGLAGYLPEMPEPVTPHRPVADLLHDVQAAFDAAVRAQPIPHLGTAGASVSGGVNADDGEAGRRFSLTIDGDCLTPDIPAGALVIFDREKAARPGAIVAAIINGERQVKRLVTRNGELTLADNYGQFVTDESDVSIMGVFERCYLPQDT